MSEVAAVMVPVAALKAWAGNPRKNDPAVDEVAASIKRFGFGSPIIARQENGEVICGHTRLKAAIRLKLTAVPVRYLDLSAEEAHAYALADNKLGEIATWDQVPLADAFRDLEKAQVDLSGLGWDGGELEKFLGHKPGGMGGGGGGGGVVTDPDEDDLPEPPAVPVSKPGEVYELGPHRLVCGDSTKAETWDAILGEAAPRCVVTDPPYGMSYKGSTFGKDGLANDGAEWEATLTDAMRRASEKLPSALMAVCFGASRLDRYFASMAGFKFERMLTIYKPNRMAHPWRGWIMTSEVIGLWSHGRAEWPKAENHCHDVYTFDYSERPDPLIDHPTVKPQSIIADLVSKLSRSGENVVDPFGGSGTTLVACAATGRVARMIELMPAFCDVIRRRWTRYARANNLDAGPGALDG